VGRLSDSTCFLKKRAYLVEPVARTAESHVPPSGSGDRQYSSLAEFIHANGLKKGHVAKILGLSKPGLTRVLNYEKYHPYVEYWLLERIAKLLNRPVSDVAELYKYRDREAE
jgi:hypothetical protein